MVIYSYMKQLGQFFATSKVPVTGLAVNKYLTTSRLTFLDHQKCESNDDEYTTDMHWVSSKCSVVLMPQEKKGNYLCSK